MPARRDRPALARDAEAELAVLLDRVARASRAFVEADLAAVAREQEIRKRLGMKPLVRRKGTWAFTPTPDPDEARGA